MALSTKQAQTGVPVAIGVDNAAGSGDAFAFANHVHAPGPLVNGLAIGRYSDIVGAANAVELFHARAGISLSGSDVTQWVGQYKGTVVPGASGERPTYGASASFAGNPVVTTTSTKRLTQTADMAASLMPVGTKPYVLSVFRRLGSTGAQATLLHLLAAGGTTNGIAIHDRSTDGTLLETFANHNWGNVAQLSSSDLTPHVVEAWLDSSSGAPKIRLDGGSVVTAAAGTTGITNAIYRVAIGGWPPPTGLNMYAEHALHFICTSYPGDNAAAQLRAWAKLDFGF